MLDRPTTAGGSDDSPSPSEPFAHRPELPGYTVIEPIGYGGMAEIWLAERAGSAGVPVRCVLKTILPKHAEREKYRDRFLDEGRIVAQLRHPNICSVLDVGSVNGQLYLAMEWVDGLDTNELIRKVSKRRTEVPLRHALYILRETLQGLHHAHTAIGSDGAPMGIVHRDVSPGNLLLASTGAVKLTDFGVSVGTAAQRIEREGTLAGKLHYFAPELFGGPRIASVKTDLWALGVTFYELLTVRPMFSRKLKPRDLRRTVEAFEIDRLLDEDLTVPEGLEPILKRALARNPAKRYDSALNFLEDVNDYAYESGLRLLGPHFAEYIARILSNKTPERRSIRSALRKRGENQ
ncbi:MAG: serine/threonine protein kinase [Proteobacteria bacterium]|nr:serine/threonine protein kinase [Pseudomonadota bacterium]